MHRRSRSPLAAVLAIGLAVVLGGLLAAPAWAQPPTPVNPPSAPTPATPGSPPPPTTPERCPPSPSEPVPSDCIPQPTLPAPNTPSPGPTTAPDDEGEGQGGVVEWIVDGITEAINGFFRGLVTNALNPLLELLGKTLLTTPTPDQLPRIGELWEQSRQFAVAAYVLLVLAAGIVLMAYETVQTRHSVKEIAPRIVVGFLAANLSLFLAGKAIAFANAASQATLGEGVNPDSAADILTSLVMGSLSDGGIFLIFIGLALAVMLVALLITYVVRVALTLILIAGAPLALMCHALPQTEGVARWWWRAFAGVLAIQLGQSLALITAMRVFFAPGGFTLFGPTADGLVNLIVSLALFYILIKIPFWILAQVRVGGAHSFAGSLIKGFIAYKTFGLLKGRGGGTSQSGSGRPQAGGGTARPGGGGGGSGPPGPLPGPPRSSPGPRVPTRPRAGQRPTSGPPPAHPQPRSTRPATGARQLTLFDDDGYADTPRPGPNGQYLPAADRPNTRASTKPVGTASPQARLPGPGGLRPTSRADHPGRQPRPVEHPPRDRRQVDAARTPYPATVRPEPDDLLGDPAGGATRRQSRRRYTSPDLRQAAAAQPTRTPPPQRGAPPVTGLRLPVDLPAVRLPVRPPRPRERRGGDEPR